MPNSPIITLTTDFGYRDPLAAIMKGVILGINPEANIVDLTHGIGKYNVREAAMVLGMSYREFPQGTIHVVVADPGVGSQRRPILVATESYLFIGPDNGVFSYVYDESERVGVYHILAEHYFGRGRSTTFHGRDIFAPVAAWASKGIEVTKFGEEIKDFARLRLPVPTAPSATTFEGEVVYIDTFGNAITNIVKKDLEALAASGKEATVRIVTKGKDVKLKEYYSQAEDKELYAVINSMDHLELFVYRGSAAKDFGIRLGDSIGLVCA
jgi:hypothetical protein